jgi:hypothetical protein
MQVLYSFFGGRQVCPVTGGTKCFYQVPDLFYGGIVVDGGIVAKPAILYANFLCFGQAPGIINFYIAYLLGPTTNISLVQEHVISHQILRKEHPGG